MRTPRFPVDATCKLPNKCQNLCASANFLDRPKMSFILFAGYVWISIISPYREDLWCRSVVTSPPCAGTVDVCHQRSQQRQVIVDRWRWWVEPTFACCFLSTTGFCWIPLFTCCKKTISNDSYLVIVAVGFTSNLYHLSRVCLKQISGFPNFLRWKMCLVFIIYIVVRKIFLDFVFRPHQSLVDFSSLQIPSANSMNSVNNGNLCLADDMLNWRATKTSETFRYDLLDRFRMVRSGGKYLGNIKQWDGKNEKQGGVMKGMKPMHAPSWRVWIQRFGLWEDVSLIPDGSWNWKIYL